MSMKKFIQLALATGALYEIPAEPIAQSRAKAMKELHADEFPTDESALKDTTELFAEDPSEIRDWALNNMNPADYMQHARLVRFTPPDFDPQHGEWSYHDLPAIIPQLDASQVLQLPVEMCISAMAMHGSVCQITILNDEARKPAAAIVLIRGSEAIIGTYYGALDQLTKAILAPAPEQAAQPN